MSGSSSAMASHVTCTDLVDDQRHAASAAAGTGGDGGGSGSAATEVAAMRPAAICTAVQGCLDQVCCEIGATYSCVFLTKSFWCKRVQGCTGSDARGNSSRRGCQRHPRRAPAPVLTQHC